jgi:hypothetical protein
MNLEKQISISAVFDACSKGGTGGDEDRLVDTTTTHRTEPYLSPGK